MALQTPSPMAGPSASRTGSSISSPENEAGSSSRYTPEQDVDDEAEEASEDEGTDDEEGIEMESLVRRQKHSAASGDPYDFEDKDGEGEETSEPPRWRRRESAQSFELYTPDEERRVKRKLDVRLVLFVALLYMLSFLDRSNIGNAKVAGMMRDLRLNDNQFEWLLTAFYISYIAFEWMTVMYQIVPPHIYISLCVFAWGVLASMQALTTAWSGLLVIRALLGVGEAAFVGIPFYLTFFFRREELAFRTGLFISAAPLATSFASSLAYGIMTLAERTKIASWRILLLTEGFPAVVVAVWCWNWIPDSPGTTWWLNPRERKVATMRLRKDAPRSRKGVVGQRDRHFSFHEVVRTLRDPKAYLTAGMFFCCNVAFSSMPVFLPTIVHSMGYTKRSSQALSAPPFLFAFVVVLVTALVSDRLKTRSIPIILHTLLAMLGYLFLAAVGTLNLNLTTLRYLVVYPICAGFFSAVTLIITWTMNNQASNEGKGTGLALLNVIGQCGPLIGTRLYPDHDRPYFITGMVVCAVAMVSAAILAVALRLVLIRHNKQAESRTWHENTRSSSQTSSVQKPFLYLL